MTDNKKYVTLHVETQDFILHVERSQDTKESVNIPEIPHSFGSTGFVTDSVHTFNGTFKGNFRNSQLDNFQAGILLLINAIKNNTINSDSISTTDETSLWREVTNKLQSLIDLGMSIPTLTKRLYENGFITGEKFSGRTQELSKWETLAEAVISLRNADATVDEIRTFIKDNGLYD